MSNGDDPSTTAPLLSPLDHARGLCSLYSPDLPDEAKASLLQALKVARSELLDELLYLVELDGKGLTFLT